MHPLARDLAFTAIDFEGTGPGETGPDKPLQIGLARMERMQVAPLHVSFLAIDQEVSSFAFRVHRISRELCAGAPSMSSKWPLIREAAASTVFVAHGAPTERKYLGDSFPLFDWRSGVQWVDTLSLARATFPYMGDHSLSALVVGLGLEDELRALIPDRLWHDALFDSAGCLVFLRHLLHQPGWENVTLTQIQNASQKEWRKLQNSKRRVPILVPKHLR